MSATDPLLRAAIRTWSRYDRAASGEVVLATAQDLVDAGGSRVREATSVVAAGLLLRGRGLRRRVAVAPWLAGFRVAVLLITGAVASLLVVELKVGGTAPITQGSAGSVAMLIAIGGCTAVGLAVACHRRWLAALMSAALLGFTGFAYLRGYQLGYAEITLATSEIHNEHGLSWSSVVTGISVDGVVGLLLAAAVVIAAVSAIVTATRGALPAPAGQSRAARVMGCWLLVVAVMPLVASVSADLISRGDSSKMVANRDSGSIIVLWLFCAAVLLATLTLRHRAPGWALGGALVAAVLAIPLVWTLIPVIPQWFFELFVVGATSALVFWGIVLVGAAWLLVGVAVSSARVRSLR